MRYFKHLALRKAEVIAQKALEFVQARPRVFNRVSNINLIRMERDAFLIAIPEAVDSFGELGLTISDVMAFVMWNRNQCGIHKDTWKHDARVNIPLLNCGGTATAFYDQVKEIVANNAQGIPVTLAQNQYATPTVVAESTGPVVLRVREFHKVVMPARAQVPRITLSLGFSRDPVFLLNND